ncbi:MAG: glycosyltransferase, partial [Ferruginibacter sp.]
MTISIIVPTFNEEKIIGELVNYLDRHKDQHVLEIIVADGNSTDATMKVARAAGARLVVAPKKGRAVQMNYGASIASGDILYFI